MFRGVNATLMVADVDQAVEFYTRTLGLDLVWREGDDWVEMAAGGGTTIGLYRAGEDNVRPGTRGSASVGLTVDGPIERAVSILRDRGVEFRGPIRDEGRIKRAFFGDVDGNPLYLCEFKEPI